MYAGTSRMPESLPWISVAHSPKLHIIHHFPRRKSTMAVEVPPYTTRCVELAYFEQLDLETNSTICRFPLKSRNKVCVENMSILIYLSKVGKSRDTVSIEPGSRAVFRLGNGLERHIGGYRVCRAYTNDTPIVSTRLSREHWCLQCRPRKTLSHVSGTTLPIC